LHEFFSQHFSRQAEEIVKIAYVLGQFMC